MRILKIKGKDEESIRKQIEKEYGEHVVIINTHKERVAGIKGWFQKAVTTVTIAVDDATEATEMNKAQEEIPKEEVISTQEEKEPFDLSVWTEMLQQQKMLNAAKVAPLQEEQEKTMEIATQKENSIKSMLSKGLINEGVAAEVVDLLMNGIAEDASIDEVARGLYVELTEILKMDYSQDSYPYIFFIGPTGVGKTTTIAKLTAGYVLNKDKKVTLFTSDTYRIAAIDQLKTYAEIIDVPVEIIYEKNDFVTYIDKWEHQDYILIDTAGRSHKNITEVEKIKDFLEYVPNKKIFLVLSMSTNYRDAQNIIDVYKEVVGEFSMIFTKLDETDAIGNLINIASYAKMPIGYVATGQDVPDDIERFEADAYIKQLLGRISYE